MDLFLIASRVASRTALAGRVEDARRKYEGKVKDIESVIETLTERDPSGSNKYLDWALAQISRDEDLADEELYAAIEQFDRMRSSLPEKDISKYDYQSLEKALKEVRPSKREVRDQAKKGGSRRVWSGDGWDVIRILSHDAMRLYGSGTMWCTTSPDPTSWGEHSEGSRIYVVTGKRSWGGGALNSVKYCVIFRPNGDVEVWNENDDQTIVDDLLEGIGDKGGEAFEAMENDA